MSLEIETKVLRGKDGRVIGISLVAGAEAYSEDFVRRFPRAFLGGKAEAVIEGDEMVFTGPNFQNREMTFRFKPTAEELEGIRKNLFGSGKKLTFKPDGMLTPGFKIILDE